MVLKTWPNSGENICVGVSFLINLLLRYLVLSWNCNTKRSNKKCEKCAIQLAGGVLLKMLQYFEVMLNFFEFSEVWENKEAWLVYVNKVSWIAQSYFLTNTVKKASPSFFFLFYWNFYGNYCFVWFCFRGFV